MDDNNSTIHLPQWCGYGDLSNELSHDLPLLMNIFQNLLPPFMPKSAIFGAYYRAEKVFLNFSWTKYGVGSCCWTCINLRTVRQTDKETIAPRAHFSDGPSSPTARRAASWLTGTLLRHGPFTSGADPNNYQPMHGLQAQLQSALHLLLARVTACPVPLVKAALRVRIRITPRADARELVSLVRERSN